MKYILLIILLFPLSAFAGDGVSEISKAIDYEMQKVRYIPPITKEKSGDMGHTFKALSKYDVGFRPWITVLPAGAGVLAGPVSVSADRRYVRIGIGPVFSHVGKVTTFNFGK